MSAIWSDLAVARAARDLARQAQAAVKGDSSEAKPPRHPIRAPMPGSIAL